METITEYLEGIWNQMSDLKGVAGLFSMLFIDLCAFIILIKSCAEKRNCNLKWRRRYEYIAIVDGKRVIPVENSEILLGRHRSADIQFPDMSVSRYHAVLTYSDGIFLLEDLNSKSGTFLNGKKIQKAVVNVNDEIRMGAVIFYIKKIKDVSNERNKRKSKA
ncbi:MAG: FHA domain-containing protein [Oscillospiraceae bacterium]|nr:FHA domain-containing protein [Oscillospiraceae bacterium]